MQCKEKPEPAARVFRFSNFPISMNPTVLTFAIVLIEHHDRNRFTHNWRWTYGAFHRI